MTAYSDFLDTIRSWINRQEMTDTIVGSWVKFAEDRFNTELRCREMVKRSYATVNNNSVPLPGRCLDLLYVKYIPVANTVPAIRKGLTFKVCSMDEYWTIINDNCHPLHRTPLFARIGNSIELNPNVDVANGTQVEIGYHATVDPLADGAATPIFTRYSRLYTYATLANSAPFLLEDNRVALWEAQATAQIQSISDAYRTEKFSGGVLHSRIRSFG